jgi:hypothetical protein
MNSTHYIRDALWLRLAGEDGDGFRARSAESGRADDDTQRGRFRRMAENRKRQILERMLLDEAITAVNGAIESAIDEQQDKADEGGRSR